MGRLVSRLLPRRARAPATHSLEPLKPRIGQVGPDDLLPIVGQARDLADGDACPDDLLLLLWAEIDRRRRLTGTDAGPSSPRPTGLRVRRSGLPEPLAAGNNLVLAAPDARISGFQLHDWLSNPPNGSIALVGSRAAVGNISLYGAASLVVVGDDVVMPDAHCSGHDGGTVLVGGRTSGTFGGLVSGRNGGIAVIGEDGMWAAHVKAMTDDCHAIRDEATGARLNNFGGRVVVGDHVWIGEEVRLFGDCFVGDHSVVGYRSFVKGAAFPPHCVTAGAPARVVKRGITWTREDSP